LLTAEVRATDFEPDEMVGVINNSHLVRLSVTDSERGGCPSGGQFRRHPG
jgi:hypothetical protein